jgi:peptidoglycan/LPS O-acetylase OafA/YrhL
LDGLRGVAAFVVYVHHALLTVPLLAMPYFDRGSPEGGLSWWITYSPLHVLWNGPIAVYVFFVLSGLVLMLPAMRATGIRWKEYYPRRVVRLCGPMWVSMIIAGLWVVVVPRIVSDTQSAWLTWHHQSWSTSQLVRDLVLCRNVHYNSPVWSLKYEVLFSLLLPVFVCVGLVFRRAGVVKAVAIVVVVALGFRCGNEYVLCMPMFGLGVLMAVHQESLTGLLRRQGEGRARILWSVGLGCLILVALNARWELRGGLLGERVSNDMLAIACAVELLGSALLVYMAWCWRPWAALLDGRVCQWLGSRSFSLYLVHEPIVVSFGLLLGPRRAWATLFLALPLVAVMTEVFYRLVERPSIEAARRAGRLAGRLLPAVDLRHPASSGESLVPQTTQKSQATQGRDSQALELHTPDPNLAVSTPSASTPSSPGSLAPGTGR